ncbi:MAG: 4-hydroxy-tetrahydrodipicolinate reductase [Clostridia bacterium]|nr:4-hydroxy-tetrahydrodipicolinate reductase [Clostridia bacterium]
MNVLIRGICGKMGTNIYELLSGDGDAKVVCGVDVVKKELPVPVYTDFNEVKEEVDVIIDFSSPDALETVLLFAEARKCGIVLGTTGYSEADLKRIEMAARRIPVFKTANLSIGVNLMQTLVRQAAQFLGDQFDVEIIEKHHNLKKDAPSGTALMLAKSVNEGRDNALKEVYGRQGMVGAREKNELGMHAVRGGTIVGEHEVLFCGEDEIITISHSARSKRVFAAGAVKAAKWLYGKPAGKYDMSDLLT